MALADNVKRLRTLRGLSQSELGKAIGVAHSRISDIERGAGNPTLATIEKLAKVFGVSPCELLDPEKIQESA